MRLIQTYHSDLLNGDGLREVLFFSGCPHKCPGCFNPETHDFGGGFLVDIEELKQGRKAFTKEEWIDVMLRSIGMEPDTLTSAPIRDDNTFRLRAEVEEPTTAFICDDNGNTLSLLLTESAKLRLRALPEGGYITEGGPINDKYNLAMNRLSDIAEQVMDIDTYTVVCIGKAILSAGILQNIYSLSCPEQSLTWVTGGPVQIFKIFAQSVILPNIQTTLESVSSLLHVTVLLG